MVSINRIPYQLLGRVWKPRDDLQKKCFLGFSCVSVTNGPFIDGRTTGIEPARGGFTIHCLDPLGYIRPYPPHRFKSLSTIRPFPPYDRYQREAFSYTIVASLLLCFGIRGSKASTSRSFLAKLQTKRLGCSLHWFYLTLLKIKDRGRAGSEGSFSRQHGFDEQQAPTPNKMKSSKRSGAWRSEPLSEKAIAR